MEDDEIIQRSDSDQETSNFIPEMTEETEKLEQTPTPIDQNTVFLQFFSENFMTICKICLTQKEDLKPLEEENLLKLQELFHQNQDEATNTEIDPEFLNLICEDCLESLEKFNSFKEQYVKSKIFLQQFKADYIVLDQDLWNGEEIEDAKFEVIHNSFFYKLKFYTNFFARR